MQKIVYLYCQSPKALNFFIPYFVCLSIIFASLVNHDHIAITMLYCYHYGSISITMADSTVVIRSLNYIFFLILFIGCELIHCATKTYRFPPKLKPQKYVIYDSHKLENMNLCPARLPSPTITSGGLLHCSR